MVNRTGLAWVACLVAAGLLAALIVACQPTPTPPQTPQPEQTTTLSDGCPAGSIRMVVMDGQANLSALSAPSGSPDNLGKLGIRVVCANGAERVALESTADAYPEQRVSLIEPTKNPGELVSGQAEIDLWGMNKIEARAAWSLGQGAGASVAVIDTGVDCGVSDLAGRCSLKKDYVGGSGRHSHGTHVAGTAAGGDDGAGVYGVSPLALVWDYRVLDVSGSGSESNVASAIVQAADDGATVQNLSLGGGPSPAIDRAVQYAQGVGAIVVAAAGNSNTDAPSSPGCSPGAVGVGATDQSDRRASFSNFGACVDLGAPGVSITSVVPGGGFETWSGTSMASPHVAGVAALLRASGVPARDVLAKLKIGDAGPSNLGGVRLNARKAVEAPPPTAGPSPTPGPVPPTATKPNPYPGPTKTPTPKAVQCVDLGLCERRMGFPAQRVCGPCK